MSDFENNSTVETNETQPKKSRMDGAAHEIRKKVKILRNTNGQDTIIEFDIRSKDIVDSELYYIQPGDVILVNRPKASFFKITSFSTFLSVVISSISFILLVINYTNN